MTFKIGSHVSMKGDAMLLGAAQEAASFNATAMMVYTGAPQNTRRKALDQFNAEAGEAYMNEHGIGDVVVHAPYVVNLGNTLKPENFAFAIDFLKGEIERAEAIGAKQIVLHPGAHVGAGAEAAIQHIAEGLNEIIQPGQKIQIALETMAGKGTEVGTSFEQLASIIEQVTNNDQLSVCFDTCHTSDAGYAIKDDFDGVLHEFDQIIGLDRLKVVHLNDSKNPKGSHKDRHEALGFGTLGFDCLNVIAHHEALTDIPKILETPLVGDKATGQANPHGYEIAMLKHQQFNPQMIEDALANRAFDAYLN